MSLCIDCGCAFCCDGTLYSRAPLKEEDLPFLAERFHVLQEEKKAGQGPNEAHFKLPCQLCVDERCAQAEAGRNRGR